MKRLICFCLVLCLLAALLAACAKEEQPETRTDVSSTPSMTTMDTSFVYEDRIHEDEELTAKGYPPLSLDLQILFQDAQEMVRSFNLCSFQTLTGVTKEIGGMPYLLISDPRFDNYDTMVTYLKRFFTDDFIYSNLLTADSCVQPGDDGLAYVVDASGAANSSYAGHVFTVEKYTTEQIDLKATVYYQESYLGEYFYQTPENESDYTTEEMDFTLVFTEKGWRFSQFPFIMG